MPTRFRTSESVLVQLEQACLKVPGEARFQVIGQSEEGRPIAGVTLGHGPIAVSLLGGAHADEPVGPETLQTFVLEGLRHPEILEVLFSTFTFSVVPHINPDGEARNRSWIDAWPDVESYLLHQDREVPGRDLEFGFPDMRPENRAVTAFLAGQAPYALHMSFHGMGFSEGAMLLIDRRWGFRTPRLQAGFIAAAQDAGLGLHDHNRRGEKGFFYLGPGFTTTPEGEAMRVYFRSLGDDERASLFADSSMDHVRYLGGDPLCLVTESPLFALPPSGIPGRPANYLTFNELIPELKARLAGGASIQTEVDEAGVRPVALADAVRLQLRTLDLGLRAVSTHYDASYIGAKV